MNDRINTKDNGKLEKIKSLIDEEKVVMMATRLDKIPFSVCPMMLQKIDSKGDLWFFSSKKSSHFDDIEYDNRVQIMYSDEQKQKYLSIYGTATHVLDDQKRDELWDPLLTNWFEGKDDPDLVLLNINIKNTFYWNTEEKKLVSFF